MHSIFPLGNTRLPAHCACMHAVPAMLTSPSPSFLMLSKVRKPDVGESKPAAVTAEVVIDTRPLRGDVRAEWDQV